MIFTYLTLVIPFLYVYYEFGYAQSKPIETGNKFILLSLLLYFFTSLLLYKLHKKILDFFIFRFLNKKSKNVDRYVTLSLSIPLLIFGVSSLILYSSLISYSNLSLEESIENLQRSVTLNSIILPAILVFSFSIFLVLQSYFLKKFENLSLYQSILTSMVVTIFYLFVVITLPTILDFIYFIIGLFTMGITFG